MAFNFVDDLFGFLFWWVSFHFNNIGNDRVHIKEDEDNMDKDWGEALKLIKWWRKDEFLIDDDRIDNKSNEGKNVENEASDNIGYRESHYQSQGKPCCISQSLEVFGIVWEHWW